MPKSRLLLQCASGCLLAAFSLAVLPGCTEQPTHPTHNYTTLEPRIVPDYLKDTIFQYTDLSGTEPFPVSGYGLVTHLHGTGGSRTPTPVRAYIVKEMERHDFGALGSGLNSPETVLNSKDVAIVRVDGLIPPGARAGTDWSTWFDVRVSIPPDSDATSLAHGVLYQADLKVNGANPAEPGGGMVLSKAQVAGAIFVNPSYVIDSNVDSPAAREGRKSGVVLAGARVLEDRPLLLRLRSPSPRMARGIEQRIIQRFQDVVDDDLSPAAGADAASGKKVANARDEGIVEVYVPRFYTDDWEHFAGLVRHLYMQGDSAEFCAQKARELADEALRPGAQLGDISYAWEGLGKASLHAVIPLMSNENPDVQFAAARAAAFLNDPGAVPVLLAIANTPGNLNRVNAVHVLSELPATPRVDRLCRSLLDSEESSVRVEAYKLLVKHQDTSVYTRWVKDGDREVFALDLVRSTGKPLIYASRQGVPRIAVFGNSTQLDLPLIFTSMDQKLTISSDAHGSQITIFYRGTELLRPLTAYSSPSITDVAALLGGDGRGPEGQGGMRGLRFSYADVVGVLQQMVDERRVSGVSHEQRLLASFMLQEPAKSFEPTNGRGLIRPGSGRQQSDTPGPEDKPVDDHLLRHAIGPVAPVPVAHPGS